MPYTMTLTSHIVHKILDLQHSHDTQIKRCWFFILTGVNDSLVYFIGCQSITSNQIDKPLHQVRVRRDDNCLYTRYLIDRYKIHTLLADNGKVSKDLKGSVWITIQDAVGQHHNKSRVLLANSCDCGWCYLQNQKGLMLLIVYPYLKLQFAVGWFSELIM